LGFWGFITLTYPTATNHTIRGMRVTKHTYSTGTVAVSGTAVTGTTTAWSTARYAVGARIGFGSTDPTAITTWYYISAIGSDTSITLSGSAGTIGSGSAYVIEELRVYTATTNATTTNGGLYVTKGINFDDFATGGTTVAAGAATDNLKAVYWLADASTVTNIAAGGLGLGSSQSDTSHDIYVINADTGTSLRIYKYNGRATLAGLASGKSTSAFTLKTGAQTVTGTLSQTNASRVANASHGPGSGADCLYTVTTTRVVRVPVASIIDASITFIADALVEVPTGNANTFAATSGFTSIEYAGTIDRFIITTGSGQRHYVTQYKTDSSPIDRVLFLDNKQLDQTVASSDIIPFPSVQSAGYSVWAQNGIAYFCRNGLLITNNHIYPIPIGADWDYAVGTSSAVQNRLITPSLSTSGCTRFGHVSVLYENLIGSTVLGIQTEPHRVFYRVSGINDDSGTWYAVPKDGDLRTVTGAENIQFMFEFRIIGGYCIPSKIYGVILTWEDNSTDSHYQPSVATSNITTKKFAWRHSVAFGGTVPTLTIKLYDAVSGSLLLTDTTLASASGTFEKSTNDGGAWGSYNSTDKGNETTYIRYTPTSLADNIKVRAILTQ
jgi:hypothetical protein